MTKRITEETAREWLELTRRGESSYQIAEKYGVHHVTVSKHLRKLGYAPGKGGGATARNNARRSKEAEATRIKRLNDLLADRFEVLESNRRFQCTLRCKTCGHVFKRTLDMRFEPRCPKCDEVLRLRKEAERNERRLRTVMTRDLVRALGSVIKYKQTERWLDSVHTCAECGAQFTVRERRESNPYDFSNNPRFCCTRCADRFHKREQRHRRREQCERTEDGSVSLLELERRDHCTCYLCGGRTDREDYTLDAHGNFIAGDSYPSIEHVIPLSKGGSHTMDNAMLAHHLCNALKGDRSIGEAREIIRARGLMPEGVA